LAPSTMMPVTTGNTITLLTPVSSGVTPHTILYWFNRS
jgi:hypothetical protein